MHAMKTGLSHACVSVKSDSDMQCSVADDRNVHVLWDTVTPAGWQDANSSQQSGGSFTEDLTTASGHG